MPSKSIYLNNWEDVNEIQTLDLMWLQSVRTLHARQDSNNLFSESTGARERREGVRLGGKGKRKNLSSVHRCRTRNAEDDDEEEGGHCVGLWKGRMHMKI